MKKAFLVHLVLGLALSAQPRVEEAAAGLHLPSAMAALPDGTVLVLQEDGKIFQLVLNPFQSSLWGELWPNAEGGSIKRTASGLAHLASTESSVLIAVYVTFIDSENEQAVSQILVYQYQKAEEGGGSVKKLAILVDRIPGGTADLGGAMAVGADGFLYAGTGTAGNNDAAQDPASLAGKILKIALDKLYLEPVEAVAPEILAKGMHSPAGLAFHPATGRLFAADRGPRAPLGRNWDEVNLIQQGGNYGWPLAYGGRAARGTSAPVIHSTSVKLWDPGAAVFVTTGPWRDSFLWTGMDSRALFRITVDARDPSKIMFFEELFVRGYGRLRAMAPLSDGRIAVATANSTAEAPASDKVYIITPR